MQNILNDMIYIFKIIQIKKCMYVFMYEIDMMRHLLLHFALGLIHLNVPLIQKRQIIVKWKLLVT